MQEEMVAWVDENENFIKTIPISLANSDPKYLHSEIAILLYNKNKRVLLQKRAATKKVLPGVWICSTAGHITFGETPEISAHREIQEEIGFDVPLFKVDRVLNSLPNERHFAHWYLGKYNGQQINLDPHEADEYAWIGEGDCDKFVASHTVAPTVIEIAKRLWSGEWNRKIEY